MHPYPDYDDEVKAAEPEPPLPSAGPPVEIAEPALVMPEIYATEVLEPLPRPESWPVPRPESWPDSRPESRSESQPDPRPEAAPGAFSPAADHPGPDHPGPDHPGPDHPGPDHPGPDHPGPDQPGSEHDADFSADDQPPGSTASLTRRNRLSRAYPIPRLTRTKRPGSVPAPDAQS